MKSQDIKSIGFALDPNGIPAFLLDWEVTKKCNLDCSYCSTGIDGGHDNSYAHPGLNDCMKTIDFMYEYVSLYMQNKKSTQRKVVLNVYGGESLFHPDIIEILTAAREKHKPYADLWELTIITTTNAVINKSIWKKIVPLIDEFTVSYHAENLPKQHQLFFDNLLTLKNNNKRFKCVVMMHNVLWDKSLSAIEFCKNNNIRYVAKPFDDDHLYYSKEQFNYLKDFWSMGTQETKEKTISICEGRACCGGRKLALNNDLKSNVTFVPRQGFRDWYCSVNWFFLFVQQISGNVYTNKDCRMGFNGRVEPLGNMQNHQSILDNLKEQFISKSMPVIQCAKSVCRCGYCAPKAERLDDFKDLISRHVITDVISYE
jgi:hypothetical protein